jgi:hypothetical protein
MKIYKIGHSTNPLKRLSTIKVANPFVDIIGVSDIPEKELHEKYDSFRIDGEWFEFNDKEVEVELLKLFYTLNEDDYKSNSYLPDRFLEKVEYYTNNYDQKKVGIFIYNLNLSNYKYREVLQEHQSFATLVHRHMVMGL